MEVIEAELEVDETAYNRIHLENHLGLVTLSLDKTLILLTP